MNKQLIAFTSLALVSSCTMSYIYKDLKPIDESSMTQKKVVRLRYELKSNMSKSREDYWFGLMKESLQSDSGISECTLQEQCDCILKVKLSDEQEDWSSWKVYASGLSMGLIPVRFKASYHVVVESPQHQKEYVNSVNTWVHLGLLPLVPLVPSRQMEAKRLARDYFASIVRNECGKM